MCIRDSFTINHLFTVGVGPDVGVFGALGVDNTVTRGAAIGGLNYGARLHTAIHPVVGRTNATRKAFSIGLDMRFLGGPSGQVETGTGGTSASASADGFIFSPYLTIGYTAF